MCGLMVGSIMESGKTIICMVKASIPGKTEECMMASTKMTENMAMVFTLGMMVNSMLDSGRMENNMELEPIGKMAEIARVFGKMESVLNGLMVKMMAKIFHKLMRQLNEIIFYFKINCFPNFS